MGISDWSSDVCSSDLQRVEDKYRQQLAQLLTPLVGADDFSTEVQAEVNLDETQAASESYNGGALRAEQGNWTTKGSDTAPAGGIRSEERRVGKELCQYV